VLSWKKVKTAITFGLVVSLFGLMAGCSAGSKNSQEQPRKDAKPQVVRIGLIPAEDSQDMIKKFKPTIEYLEKKLGTKVEAFTATDYSGVIEAMRAKHIDIAFFGPFSYVLAADKANGEAFAVGVRDNGKSTYQSIIITHKDSGIKNLGDIKGKDFAFVDPAAAAAADNDITFERMVKEGLISPEENVIIA